jgi:hypothetical protein
MIFSNYLYFSTIIIVLPYDVNHRRAACRHRVAASTSNFGVFTNPGRAFNLAIGGDRCQVYCEGDSSNAYSTNCTQGKKQKLRRNTLTT